MAEKGKRQTQEHIDKRVAAITGAARKPRDRKAILLKKVLKDENGCWVWQGAVFKKPTGNYGMIRIGPAGGSKTYKAHRISYEVFVGDIPKGLEIDHTCRNKLCINPEHLEPVTHTENMHRRLDVFKSHCKHGHEMSEGNTYIEPNGDRHCRACKKTKSHESYLRKRDRVDIS